MSTFICRSCRASRYALRQHGLSSTRTYSSQLPPQAVPEVPEAQEPQKHKRTLNPHIPNTQTEIQKALKPRHTLSNYMNPKQPVSQKLKIKPEELHHLLRLSALPMPKSPEEEEKMLNTLALQLQFVKKMQKVNTDGVEPLQSIRDESAQGREEATIGLESLRGALAKEDIKGRSRRPRRRREVVDTKGVEDWDVLGTASEKVETPMGKYFVVTSGKEKEGENE